MFFRKFKKIFIFKYDKDFKHEASDKIIIILIMALKYFNFFSEAMSIPSIVFVCKDTIN